MRVLILTSLGLLFGVGCAVPAESPPAKGEEKSSAAPKGLIPAELDPAIRKQALAILDPDIDVGNRAIDAMVARKLAALPYLLEIYLDEAGEARPDLMPVVGRLTSEGAGRRQSVTPAASEMLREALAHPIAAVRRGAAANLFFDATWGSDPAGCVALLRKAAGKDGDKGVRDQAAKALGFIAVEVMVNHLLAPDATKQTLARDFRRLEAIGAPAVGIITKALKGTEADLAEAEKLQQIRVGIGGDRDPALDRRIALLGERLRLADQTLAAIRKGQDADK